MLGTRLGCFVARIAMALTLTAALAATARAEDKLLAETVEFTGTFIFLEAKVPGLVIGVVSNGETVVRGFGEIAQGSGKAPDGDTPMRIGSITKVFCGATLASMVADGKVAFTDRLQDRLGWDVTIPSRDGKEIRLIDLATQASGLPREAEDTTGETPTSDRSKEDYVKSLSLIPCCSRRVPAFSIRISVSTCWRKPWPTQRAGLIPSF
jgi:D-alanyl-D-alanine-carboxypeptidase/D-alanyl-D-alanine-endopeptidase